MYLQWGMEGKKLQVKGKMMQFKRRRCTLGVLWFVEHLFVIRNCLLLKMVLLDWLLIPLLDTIFFISKTAFL